ncbi:Methyltransferase domain-containing protein [Cryptosporangium aurantiacum]|uniref:Methyltransferase domain-containing protein n=1 Tax=Cryptosporangium aurantiacum TaxID=134849 RepID=A0A1M7TXS8_9ACTN|nr:Methyltransferase domain-containing protein [Cryptosporangium aurantiacum]
MDAARYDRTRPRYPDALVRRIAAAGPDILDVGTGTGIVARQLRTAGATVLGVEPDERMAAFARDTGVPVEVTTFEAWDPGGRTFDAVVAGQTWHWVDPVAGAAKAAEVLRPGGRIVLFWHVFQVAPALAEASAAVLRRVAPELPFDPRALARPAAAYEPMLGPVVDALRRAGFGEPERWDADEQRTYTKDEWLDQIPTQGMLTRLPADAVAEVIAEAGTAIDTLGGAAPVSSITVALAATAPAGIRR